MNTSILNVHCRPVVNFDVTDPNHRAWVYKFRQTGSWGDCPVLFYSPKELSVVGHTTQLLLDHYLSSEFSPPQSKKLLSKQVKSAAQS